MLGGLFILGELIGQIGSYVQDETQNTINKNKAIEDEKLTYLDRQHHQRLVSNDRPVVIKQINGQAWYVDAQTEKPYVNLGQRLFDDNYSRAVAAGKTVVPIGGLNPPYYKDRIQGRRYYDIETKDIYVSRELCCAAWYIRLSDFSLVRMSDSSLKLFKDKPEYIEKLKRDVQDYIDKNPNFIKNALYHPLIGACDEWIELRGEN